MALLSPALHSKIASTSRVAPSRVVEPAPPPSTHKSPCQLWKPAPAPAPALPLHEHLVVTAVTVATLTPLVKAGSQELGNRRGHGHGHNWSLWHSLWHSERFNGRGRPSREDGGHDRACHAQEAQNHADDRPHHKLVTNLVTLALRELDYRDDHRNDVGAEADSGSDATVA